jgi:predicted porin
MKYPLVCAAALAVALSAGQASAADLGGNCCADLEERIAELEATTARKGNRKVSLTVYGQVNEAVMYWDDGSENNVYVVTNDNSRSRFGFKGDAKIQDGWKAGYVLEIGVRGANSKRFNQIDGDAVRTLDVRHSRWFLASKDYGTVSVGTTPTANEGVTEINLAHTKDVAKYSDVEDSALGLFLRTTTGQLSTGGVQWRRMIRHTGDQPGETERRQGIWYVSPELFKGFNVEAGWGTDDYWDVGLKYKGEHAGFKLAAGIAYGQSTTEEGNDNAFVECLSTGAGAASNAGNSSRADCEHGGGSISVMHEDTGLYFNLAGGWFKDNNATFDDDLIDTNADDTSTFYAIEAGIQKKFMPLGATTLFGQYYNYEGGANVRLTVAAADPIHGNPLAGDANVFSSDVKMYGGGVVQELEAAGMLLYAYYRHYETDLVLADDNVVFQSAPLNDLDVVVAGGLIKF